MDKETKAIGVLPATGSIRISWQPLHDPDLPGPKPSRTERVYPILGFVVYEREGDISTDPLFLMVQNVMSLQTLKDLDPDAGVIGHLVTIEDE